MREARRTNARADWRLAAMVVMCFFGCSRHDDLLEEGQAGEDGGALLLLLQGISAAGVRSMSAVISMVRELMGQEDVISRRERNIKKSVVKEVNLRKVQKEKRRPGTIRDVKAIVREARRTNARADWRLAAMVVMCFFGCRRHDDLLRIRFEDVTMYSDRIRVFMRKNKTDVFNEGSVCSITLGGKAFNVKGFLDDYVRRMGLEKSSWVFPKNLGKGGQGVPTTYPVMYRELEDMKTRATSPGQHHLALLACGECD